MSASTPFNPVYGSSAGLGATSSSANTSLDAAHTTTILITNAGPDMAFVRFGVGVGVATTYDLPVLPNSAQTVSVRAEVNNVAAICRSGETATLYFTRGIGV